MGHSGDKTPSFPFGGGGGDLQENKCSEALQSILDLFS